MADECKASAGASGAKASKIGETASPEVKWPASDRGFDVPGKTLVHLAGLSAAQSICEYLLAQVKLKIVQVPPLPLGLLQPDTIISGGFDASHLTMKYFPPKPGLQVAVALRPSSRIETHRGLHIWIQKLVCESLEELWRSDRLLHSVLLMAAEYARENFLASGKLRFVEEFAVGWLMLRPTRKAWATTMQAVVDVLLSDDWRSPGCVDDRPHVVLRDRFRNSVETAHRVQKPLWENKIGGGVIGSLNITRRLEGGCETEAGLLLPSDADVEATVLGRVSDQRPLSQAMARLTATEQQIALRIASGQTWKEAAASVGQPETAGWNVCRKLKRSMKDLVDRQQRRQQTVAEGRVA
ncbi:hypothetical protein ILP97_18260 [Amycolatopsis sp. H6(2020)]|nr:hypothetical protein [Amycolatopsis sp. H6(2020)]